MPCIALSGLIFGRAKGAVEFGSKACAFVFLCREGALRAHPDPEITGKIQQKPARLRRI
jgi:hypothetical protein